MTKKEIYKEIFAEFQAKKFKAEEIANKYRNIAQQNAEYKNLIAEERFLKIFFVFQFDIQHFDFGILCWNIPEVEKERFQDDVNYIEFCFIQFVF